MCTPKQMVDSPARRLWVPVQLLLMISLHFVSGSLGRCLRVVEVEGLDSSGRRLPGMFRSSFLGLAVDAVHASVFGGLMVISQFLRVRSVLGS